MLLQPSAREKNLTLLVDYDLVLPTVYVGGPGRIRQVLTNLMGNAVKFTSQGHVLVRVTGVPDLENGQAVVNIAIEDTGIGIPEDKIAHIFGEFNQVENERNRQFDGTGLGLAISKRLVDLMSGEMWVTSEDGVGSCFGFKVPFALGTTEMPAHPPVPEGLRRMLVVDDIEANRTILQRQLEQIGMGVVTCANAKEALEHLDQIDLVLTDHNMPGMDGLELAEAIRATGSEVPIILLSSNTTYATNDPGAQHVHAILQKPLPRADLFAHLQSVGPLLGKQENGAPTSAQDERKMRVLAAEDNKTNQLVFRKMVKDAEIELEFAGNGVEAVELFQSFKPDMIFMDISMPKMDGKEAATKIRQIEIEAGGHTPIVALTAHAMDGDDQGILASGIDHYLTKPLRKPEIHAKLREFCPPEATPPLPEEDPADRQVG